MLGMAAALSVEAASWFPVRLNMASVAVRHGVSDGKRAIPGYNSGVVPRLTFASCTCGGGLDSDHGGILAHNKSSREGEL